MMRGTMKGRRREEEVVVSVVVEEKEETAVGSATRRGCGCWGCWRHSRVRDLG